MRKVGLAAVFALSGGIALVLASGARAQESQIQIAQLECGGSPEVVAVRNSGGSALSLVGWTLQSDRPEDGHFNLSAVGVLNPGETVFVQSGPGAGGLFVWSAQPVFRDGDSSDYARIVEVGGAVIHQVNCVGSPVVTPSPSPTPAPSASPAPDVPNGGGLPAEATGSVSPTAMVLTGAVMVSAGLATSVLSWPVSVFNRRRAAQPSVAQAPPRQDSVRGRRRRASAAGSLFPIASLLLLAAVVVMLARGGRRAKSAH